MYSPNVPPTARRIAFWLAVAVGATTVVRLVVLLLIQAGVVGTATASSTVFVVIVVINLLLIAEAALAGLSVRAGEIRRAKWAFVVIAFLGLLNLLPTLLAVVALWLLRRRSVVED